MGRVGEVWVQGAWGGGGSGESGDYIQLCRYVFAVSFCATLTICTPQPLKPTLHAMGIFSTYVFEEIRTICGKGGRSNVSVDL
jgi:hypothetical protein